MRKAEKTIPPVLDSAVPDETPTGTTAALTPTEADPTPGSAEFATAADEAPASDGAMDAGAADAQLTADRAAGDAQPLDPNALDQIEQQRTEDAPQAEPDTRLLDTSDQDNTTEPEPAYPLPALGDQVLYRNPDTADEKLHPAWVTVIDDERQVVSLFVLFETFSNFVGGVSSGDDPGAWRPA